MTGPNVASAKRVMQRIGVDVPARQVPIRSTTWPLGRWKDTSDSARSLALSVVVRIWRLGIDRSPIAYEIGWGHPCPGPAGRARSVAIVANAHGRVDGAHHRVIGVGGQIGGHDPQTLRVAALS